MKIIIIIIIIITQHTNNIQQQTQKISDRFFFLSEIPLNLSVLLSVLFSMKSYIYPIRLFHLSYFFFLFFAGSGYILNDQYTNTHKQMWYTVRQKKIISYRIVSYQIRQETKITHTHIHSYLNRNRLDLFVGDTHMHMHTVTLISNCCHILMMENNNKTMNL